MENSVRVLLKACDTFLAEIEDQRYTLHSAVEGNDLDVIDYDDVRKAFSRIEIKLHAQEKELRQTLERIIEAKQNNDSWKSKNVMHFSADDRVQKLQWYRLCGMQDFVNYLLGKIGLSNDSRFEVKELLS